MRPTIVMPYDLGKSVVDLATPGSNEVSFATIYDKRTGNVQAILPTGIGGKTNVTKDPALVDAVNRLMQELNSEGSHYGVVDFHSHPFQSGPASQDFSSQDKAYIAAVRTQDFGYVAGVVTPHKIKLDGADIVAGRVPHRQDELYGRLEMIAARSGVALPPLAANYDVENRPLENYRDAA